MHARGDVRPALGDVGVGHLRVDARLAAVVVVVARAHVPRHLQRRLRTEGGELSPADPEPAPTNHEPRPRLAPGRPACLCACVQRECAAAGQGAARACVACSVLGTAVKVSSNFSFHCGSVVLLMPLLSTARPRTSAVVGVRCGVGEATYYRSTTRGARVRRPRSVQADSRRPAGWRRKARGGIAGWAKG